MITASWPLVILRLIFLTLHSIVPCFFHWLCLRFSVMVIKRHFYFANRV